MTDGRLPAIDSSSIWTSVRKASLQAPDFHWVPRMSGFPRFRISAARNLPRGTAWKQCSSSQIPAREDAVPVQDQCKSRENLVVPTPVKRSRRCRPVNSEHMRVMAVTIRIFISRRPTEGHARERQAFADSRTTPTLPIPAQMNAQEPNKFSSFLVSKTRPGSLAESKLCARLSTA